MCWDLLPTQPTTCRVTAPCARHRAVLEGLSVCRGTGSPAKVASAPSTESLPALLNLHGSEVMPTKVCSAGL